ncbi:MAG: hypothetical protein ACRETQ_01740 [Gammaproteobacteria bacterium]
MKTIVRIVTISLVFGLAGAFTEAWAAQSVPSLIKEGQATLGDLGVKKSALAAAVQKNHALDAQGQEIQQEQKSLQAAIKAYQDKVASVNEESAQYKKQCDKKDQHLTPDEYKQCTALRAKINDDINSVNTEPDQLKTRQTAFIAKANAYNAEVKSSPDQVKDADKAYEAALATAETWLDRARDLVASQAFLPFAKKANCPNVQKPSTSVDGMVDMGQQILSCLKRVDNVGT